jgi:hypothetical protein
MALREGLLAQLSSHDTRQNRGRKRKCRDWERERQRERERERKRERNKSKSLFYSLPTPVIMLTISPSFQSFVKKSYALILSQC